MYTEALNSGKLSQRHAPTTRKLNEAVCLMASEDEALMKKIVVTRFVIERAYSSAYYTKYMN